MFVDEMIHEVLTGVEDLKKLKRELEKATIKHVLAPLKLVKQYSIKENYSQKMRESAEISYQTLTSIAGSLDTSIKGAGRKAIESTIKEHAKKYNDI